MFKEFFFNEKDLENCFGIAGNIARNLLKATRKFYKVHKTSKNFLILQKIFRINLELLEASTSDLSKFFFDRSQFQTFLE